MSKKTVLAVAFILLLISLILSSQVKAEISNPLVPEFTVEYFDNSYDIAPTFTTDPYTNNTITQTYGNHVDNRTVVITIKNTPFTPFKDGNGNAIYMFYNVRYKGTFGQDWTRKYGVERMVFTYDDPDNNYGYKIQNYASQDTVVTIASPAQQGQMDIQVEALQGYTNRTGEGHIIFSWVSYSFYGEESGWSNTKTITLGETSPYTPTPSSSPSQGISTSQSPPIETPSSPSSPTLEPTIEPTLATEPTIEPTSTPKRQIGFLDTNLPNEYGYAIVAVLVIVVAGLSLVYLKKLRK